MIYAILICIISLPFFLIFFLLLYWWYGWWGSVVAMTEVFPVYWPAVIFVPRQYFKHRSGSLTHCFKPLKISLLFFFLSFTTFMFMWWDFGFDFAGNLRWAVTCVEVWGTLRECQLLRRSHSVSKWREPWHGYQVLRLYKRLRLPTHNLEWWPSSLIHYCSLTRTVYCN